MLHSALIFAATGSAGGLVYNILITRKTDLLSLLKCAFVSAFTGVIGGLGAMHYNMGLDGGIVCAGLSGFAGGFGLLIVLAHFMKKVGISRDMLSRYLNPESEPDVGDIVSHLMVTKSIGVPSDERLNELLDKGEIDGTQYAVLHKWFRSVHADDAGDGDNTGGEGE